MGAAAKERVATNINKQFGYMIDERSRTTSNMSNDVHYTKPLSGACAVDRRFHKRQGRGHLRRVNSFLHCLRNPTHTHTYHTVIPLTGRACVQAYAHAPSMRLPNFPTLASPDQCRRSKPPVSAFCYGAKILSTGMLKCSPQPSEQETACMSGTIDLRVAAHI